MKMPRWWIERRIKRLEDERMLIGVKLAEYEPHRNVVFYFDESVKLRVRTKQIDIQLDALRKALA